MKTSCLYKKNDLYNSCLKMHLSCTNYKKCYDVRTCHVTGLPAWVFQISVMLIFSDYLQLYNDRERPVETESLLKRLQILPAGRQISLWRIN